METAEDILISKCTCKACGSVDERVICVHSLVPLYQLTLLQTDGYMAQYILIEFKNRWRNRSNELISDLTIEPLKRALTRMGITTGMYTTIETDVTKFSIKSMLYQYNVGTQKSKHIRHYYPDLKLMIQMRMLPSVSVKSIMK